jgi:hypothetical protein
MIGFRFMSTAIVQRTHRASPFQAPGEPAGHVAGDGGQQQRGGCLFQNGLSRMALIDMLEFMGEHAGQLIRAGCAFQQAAENHHPAARCGECVDGRVIDDGEGDPIGGLRMCGGQRLRDEVEFAQSLRIATLLCFRRKVCDDLPAQ